MIIVLPSLINLVFELSTYPGVYGNNTGLACNWMVLHTVRDRWPII